VAVHRHGLRRHRGRGRRDRQHPVNELRRGIMLNHPEIAPGLYGAALTLFGAIASFCTAAIPVLQFFALIGTIVAGSLTSVWTYKKIRAENVRASAVIAAAAVKATAVVTATALEENK
jgi:hypothetical protein